MIPGIQISSFRPLLSTPEGVAQVMAETARMGCTTVQLQWVDFSVPPEVIVREMERRGIRSVSTQDLFEVVQARLDYFIRLNRLSGGEWVCVSRIPPEYAGPAAGWRNSCGSWNGSSSALRPKGSGSASTRGRRTLRRRTACARWMF